MKSNRTSKQQGLTGRQKQQMRVWVKFCVERIDGGYRGLAQLIPTRTHGWLAFVAAGRWNQIAPTMRDYESLQRVYESAREFSKPGQRIMSSIVKLWHGEAIMREALIEIERAAFKMTGNREAA